MRACVISKRRSLISSSDSSAPQPRLAAAVRGPDKSGIRRRLREAYSCRFKGRNPPDISGEAPDDRIHSESAECRGAKI